MATIHRKRKPTFLVAYYVLVTMFHFNRHACAFHVNNIHSNSNGKHRNIVRHRFGDSSLLALHAYGVTNGNDDGDDDSSLESSYADRNSIWNDIATALLPPPDFLKMSGDEPMLAKDLSIQTESILNYMQSITLTRVGLPSFVYALFANILYSPLSHFLSNLNGFDHDGVYLVVSQDSSQYIQNILTTSGLMFSIMMGYTYYFLYQQQEAIYLALFDEVSESKSLLEQVSLVLRGRASTYGSVLDCIQSYVEDDLKCLDTEPSLLLSSRPVDDPLESVMFYTSVGEPSIVYDTIRSLRQARSRRLGALQRKLPDIHMILLYSLAFVVLSSFPVLGAGVQVIGGEAILQVQSFYFGIIVFGIIMALSVINELRKPYGGIYNTDAVLNVMTFGLEEELYRKKNDLNSVASEEAPTVDVKSFELTATNDIPEDAKYTSGSEATSSSSFRRRVFRKLRGKPDDL